MPTQTTKYGLVKPDANETVDIAMINQNMDDIDAALTPTADPTQVPSGNGPGKLEQWIGWLTNRIKAIIGKTNWYDAPSKNLEDLNIHLSNGVQHKIVDSINGAKYVWAIENGQLYLEEVG